MHTYGGITPMNVWDIDFATLQLLVAAATRTPNRTEADGG